MKFVTKLIRHHSHHLRDVATLRWKIKKLNSSRYSADMDENTNKLHFKFNASMRVTVYAKYMYLLAEYLKY